MYVTGEYVEVPMQELHQDEDSGEEVIQEIVRQHMCNKHCFLSCAIKGTYATGGAIGGAAVGSIPTVICVAITYLGMELSGARSLAPGNNDADMTKVTIGIILTLGAGFAALLTMVTLPIYGAVKGGAKGWKKGQQVSDKYFSISCEVAEP